MGSKRAKNDCSIPRELDRIAELIERQDFPAALRELRRIEEVQVRDVSRDDTGRLDLYAAEAFCHIAQYDEGLARANAAVKCFQHGKAHRLYGRAKFFRGRMYLAMGDFPSAIDDFSESAFAFRRIEDAEGEFNSCNYIARCCFIQGRYDKAREHLQRTVELGEKLNDPKRLSMARANIGRVMTLLGQFEDARKNLMSDMSDSGAASPVSRCNRHGSIGYLLVLMREFDEAARHLESKRILAVEHSLSREMATYHEYSGELAFWQGDGDQAETHYRQAIKIGLDIAPEGDLISQSYRLLAELQVQRGELDNAENSCDKAWQVANKIGEQLEIGAVQRVRGSIFAGRNNIDAAREAFDDSIRIFSEIGAKYELARTYLATGETEIFENQYRLTNLFAARGLFEQTGVAYWQNRVADRIEQMMTIDISAATSVRTTGNIGARGSATFIASSSRMRNILDRVDKIKNTDMTVLLLGETGVGKDKLARFIHLTSDRRDKPFESVCAVNLPDHLWESELFGHQKGTFTGAVNDRPGILERADGGTVYLNEISEIPLNLQAKMLHFLETKEIRRLGSSRTVRLDIRFIAASNRDLIAEIEAGRFRADLYFRLCEMPIILPPLRNRNGDVRKLAAHFLELHEFPAAKAKQLLESSFGDLLDHAPWPGNVRQLEHAMRRLVVLVNGSGADQMAQIAHEIMLAEGMGSEGERLELISSLRDNGWNQRRTARELGLGESTLRAMMKRMNISRPAKQ